jgi:hypothetical protein
MNTKRLKGEIIAIYGSQKLFGSAMQWHANKVSKMLKKKYMPDVDEAADIAEALKLTDDKFCEIFLHRPSPNCD